VTGGLGPSFCFLSPLIEPDVRISRIRLSGWLHGKAHGSESRMDRGRTHWAVIPANAGIHAEKKRCRRICLAWVSACAETALRVDSSGFPPAGWLQLPDLGSLALRPAGSHGRPRRLQLRVG
jgi:hypothetical protein